MANKWVQKLQKMNAVVAKRKDVYAKIVQSPSPSVNFTFGRTHGLPRGYSCVMYGPPKGGKSVLSHMMMGQVHQDDPEAIVVKVDTEYRADGQLDEASSALYGIDTERMVIIQTNSPKDIFDQIEKDIAALCEQGAPIHLIVIDSLNGIQGLRTQNSESIEKVTIGDHAKTVQEGLKRIIPVIRKYDIALVLIDQVRAEMDINEQMRGNKTRMQSSFGVQHSVEYFMAVEADKTAAGRKDLLGREMINDAAKDLAGKDGKGELTGMKIKVKMKDSTMGSKGRTGVFTYDFARGIVNTHEEVFLLGVRRGILKNKETKQGWYAFEDKTWHGEPKMLAALQGDPGLCDRILAELLRRDLNNEFALVDAEENAANNERAEEAE